jgi:D-threo-aldose 1-dehydrogenase
VPHYGAGLSERRIGEFLAGRPREEFTVCTKVGQRLVPAHGDVQGAEGFYGTPPLARVRDYSRDGVRRSLEESLGRLGPDRVDIALTHDPDDFMGQAVDEAYPALAELRAQGMVRVIGAGMNAAAPLAWLIERCDLNCVLVAGRYTLLDDSAADSLQSGVLDRARRMRDACARHGVPLPAAAPQFTLHDPAVTAAVIGARTAEEITADVSYLEMHIPGALWAELDPGLPTWSEIWCDVDNSKSFRSSRDRRIFPGQRLKGASTLHNYLASIFTAPSVTTWSDMSGNTRKTQVTRLVTLRHRSTMSGALGSGAPVLKASPRAAANAASPIRSLGLTHRILADQISRTE